MPLPSEPQGFNLHSFRQIIGDPARPYLFLVNIPQIGRDTVVTAMAKSTSLPPYTLGKVPVNFQGVPIQIGTVPTFGNWNVTFLCDEAHELRKLFMSWQSIIYDIGTGTTGHSNEYKSDQVGVAQLARTGGIVSTYNFVGAFPESVAEITVGHDQGGALEEFAVTFSYDYFIVDSAFGESTKVAPMVRGNIVQVGRGNALPENGNFNPQ
jgi:hypothetical protein